MTYCYGLAPVVVRHPLKSSSQDLNVIWSSKGRYFGLKSVKLLILILYSQAWIRQTKYVVMITKEGSIKIIVNMYYNLPYKYFTSIAIVLKDYDAAFLYNYWFLYTIIMRLLICKYASFCKVSDTQVTVKVCGPLVWLKWRERFLNYSNMFGFDVRCQFSCLRKIMKCVQVVL